MAIQKTNAISVLSRYQIFFFFLTKYSGNLKTRLAWNLNGEKLPESQIISLSNVLNTNSLANCKRSKWWPFWMFNCQIVWTRAKAFAQSLKARHFIQNWHNFSFVWDLDKDSYSPTIWKLIHLNTNHFFFESPLMSQLAVCLESIFGAY